VTGGRQAGHGRLAEGSGRAGHENGCHLSMSYAP
jgi:hypothetical protein